ncbi:MAG: hypothetical protein AAGH79_17570, partial [Bacteroidota bacterium]
HQFWQASPQWIPYSVGTYFSKSFELSNWWWLEIGLHSLILLSIVIAIFRMGVKSWIHGIVLMIWGLSVWPFWILYTW